MPNNGTKRIGGVVASFMIGIALAFDAAQFILQFIPVIGQVAGMFIGFFAACMYALWFTLAGVSYFGGKKAGYKTAAAFLTPLVELIPFLGAIPAITAGVTTIIVASRMEDAAPSGVGATSARVATALPPLRAAGKVAQAASVGNSARRVSQGNARFGSESRSVEKPVSSARAANPLPVRFGPTKLPPAANDNAQDRRKEAA